MFLFVKDGPHAGRWFDCSRGPLRIGRRMPPAHVLLINEASASRWAASIEHDARGYVFRDLSESGSFVNEVRVSGGDVVLTPGDEIRIGSTRLTVTAERGADPAPELVAVDGAKLRQVALLHPVLAASPASEVVNRLLDQELHARGLVDALTGLTHIVELRDALARRFPRDPKAGWRGVAGEVQLSALAVDVRGLNQINDQLDMAAGNEVLRLLARALRTATPAAYHYRLHGDAFAAVFPMLEASLLEHRRAVESHFSLALSTSARLQHHPIALCFAALQLTVRQPYSSKIFGPLLELELERALAIARVHGVCDVQQRTVELHAFIPQR